MLGNRAVSQELIELGNRIRSRRLEAHLSQEILAEKAGISVNTVSRIEGGQTAMSIGIFRKIVQILGVDANVLLGETLTVPEENGRIFDICHRVQHLKKWEQLVVLQTMETLVEGLCKHESQIPHI